MPQQYVRHPSESFIKYLMTSGNPNAGVDTWIAHTVEALGFPQPDVTTIAWLRHDFFSRMPVNFQPQNKYHRESMRFLKAEQIYLLHHPDKHTRECHLLVTNLKARPIIESLLLGRLDSKEIAKKVNSRLGEFITVEAIEAYGRYYWNVGLLTVEQWTVLLADYDHRRDQTLAIVNGGQAMALHKLGFQQNLESKIILRDMLDSLYFDFREWRAKPQSSAKTKAMTAIARSAVLVDTQLSQADSALKESLKAFEHFRIKQQEQGVADIRDLAPGGNFTGSGMKLLEAPVEKEKDKVA